MAKSKLTDDLRGVICDLLAAGNTDKDACAAVGITPATFYNWMKDGEQATRGRFFEFFEAVTRARAEARQGAVEALRGAIEGRFKTVTERSILEEETRLKPNGEPYNYKHTLTERSITYHHADWRAAVEYLKRRDTDHWSEKVNTEQHITIESAVETAADEFERIIRQRGRVESMAGQSDDAAEGGAEV